MSHCLFFRKRLGALALVLVLAAVPMSARAEEEDESLAYEGSVGIGAAISTLIYSPLKVAFAATGLVVSSLAWIWTFGDTSISGPIYERALGGDYVITPDHLSGEMDLELNGSS
ncbi:MAG: hypothetical protein V3T01_15215 [Myxococcota bacterium]